MEGKELNIKSTTIEKGLDLAKEFLGKLIGPTIEEIGLLGGDSLKYYRFKIQLNTLLKSKKYAEKNNVKLKEIPLKILVPLLDNLSIEEDEELQDKWAKMIVNLADSEKNFQSQIFPYLLNQISKEEFDGLQELLEKESEYNILVLKYSALKENDKFKFDTETKQAEKAVDLVNQEGYILYLEEFETANLIRLGLIRQLPPKIYVQEFSAGGSEYEGREQWFQLDASYESYPNGYRITELGRKFIEICELERDS